MSISVLMDIIACDGGTVSLSTALRIPGSPIPTAVAKRRRRLWSDNEKRRIVAETLCPGASVADIARRHGMNANLLFNWRRTARAVLGLHWHAGICGARTTRPDVGAVGQRLHSDGRVCLRARWRAGADRRARGRQAAAAPCGRGSCGGRQACGPDRDRPGRRKAVTGRWLRNQRALQRVLTVLKARS